MRTEAAVWKYDLLLHSEPRETNTETRSPVATDPPLPGHSWRALSIPRACQSLSR